jgi:hypothetical protein
MYPFIYDGRVLRRVKLPFPIAFIVDKQLLIPFCRNGVLGIKIQVEKIKGGVFERIM